MKLYDRSTLSSSRSYIYHDGDFVDGGSLSSSPIPCMEPPSSQTESSTSDTSRDQALTSNILGFIECNTSKISNASIFDARIEVLRIDRSCQVLLKVQCGELEIMLYKQLEEFYTLRKSIMQSITSRTYCNNGACRQFGSTLKRLRFFKHRYLNSFDCEQLHDLRLVHQCMKQLESFMQKILLMYQSMPRDQQHACVLHDCYILWRLMTFLEDDSAEVFSSA